MATSALNAKRRFFMIQEDTGQRGAEQSGEEGPRVGQACRAYKDFLEGHKTPPGLLTGRGLLLTAGRFQKHSACQEANPSFDQNFQRGMDVWDNAGLPHLLLQPQLPS